MSPPQRLGQYRAGRDEPLRLGGPLPLEQLHQLLGRRRARIRLRSGSLANGGVHKSRTVARAEGRSIAPISIAATDGGVPS